MTTNSKKTLVAAFAYWARNLRSGEMFRALREYCSGDVLDVGGRDFYLTAKEKGANFKSWTTLEPREDTLLKIADDKFRSVSGDGCRMDFKDNSFDTILNIQVLEHVVEPLLMVKEISRVLRPSGYAIFLIPQTSVQHELPAHYYNFTRSWVEEAMHRSGLVTIELKPLGGVWSSMASHLVYFFFKAFRFSGYSLPVHKRNVLFYVFFPLMLLYALMSIPICLLLSFGDLTEEPNNYLVVARKTI